MTNTAVPVQPAAVQQLQLQQQQLQQQQLQQQQLTQQLQQQQLQQQQQSAQVIAAQQAEVRAKIEEETQKKIAESSISHEENMSISGSNARYMVMQKLSRKTEVRRGRLELSLSYPYSSTDGRLDQTRVELSIHTQTISKPTSPICGRHFLFPDGVCLRAEHQLYSYGNEQLRNEAQLLFGSNRICRLKRKS